MAKPNLTNDETEVLLAEIMAALFPPNGEAGWNNWSRYAAAGEWF